MFTFIKKLLGYPTEAEKAAAKVQAEAPYKVEVVPVAHTEVPISVVVPVADPAPVVAETAPAAPAKKERKPRAEKPAKEKAAKPKKPAAITAKKPGRKPKAK